MKKGMICLLLSGLLSAAFFCAPVRAEEVPGEEQTLLLLEEPERQSVGRPADVRIFVNPAAA